MTNSTASSARPRQTFNSLQVLRGIAASAVVFFHGVPNALLFKYGFTGVDMFFVLSGFIIFYVHHKDIGNTQKLKSYVIKRIIRIHPLYTILTLIYAAIILPFGHSISFEYLAKSLVLFPEQRSPLLGVAWTLQHEYLFYSLFCLAILSRKIILPFSLIWAASIVSFLILQPTWVESSPALTLVFSPKNLEFLMGGWIGYYFLKGKLNNLGLLLPIGVILFLVSVFNRHFEFVTLTHPIAWGVPFSFMIMGLLAIETNRNLSPPKFLVYLGDASYSIYLSHIISLVVLKGAVARLPFLEGNASSVTVGILLSCVSIALGCLCYSFLEKPITKFLRNRLAAPHPALQKHRIYPK